MPNQPALAGKIVVVIGCATGIGARTALLFARKGARLALGDIDGEGAEAVAAAIRESGGDAVAMRVDIANEAEVNALAALAVGQFGGIDALANIAAASNLGALDSLATAIDVDLDVWDRTMAINLRGFLLAMRAVVPAMLARGKGAIVNVSSVGATHPQTFMGAYCASKAGVDSLTKHIAAAYGRRGIRCNAVAPGPIATEQNQTPESMAYFGMMQRYLPSQRLGEPEDVGSLMAFLLSDEAGFINGEVIRVDGGALCYAPWSAELDFGTFAQPPLGRQTSDPDSSSK